MGSPGKSSMLFRISRILRGLLREIRVWVFLELGIRQNVTIMSLCSKFFMVLGGSRDLVSLLSNLGSNWGL